MDAGVVREEYCADLSIVYSFGPPFGRRVVTHADLDQLEVNPRTLRRSAFDHLEALAGDRAQYHGQPPSLMLSFDGLESSLLLATEFWNRLQGIMPGELVVGVPARDVVIVTGSQLPQGLEKVRRAVDRVFFAGDENLLTKSLLVRRGGTWEPFDRAARQGPRPAAHAHPADRPPRQYQEHPSWPGERVPVAAARDGRPMGEAAPERPIGRPVAPPMAPAAATGVPMPSATSLPPMPPVPMPPGPMAPPPMSAPPLPTQRPGPMGLPSRMGPPLPTRAPSAMPGPTPAGPMASGPMPSGPLSTGSIPVQRPMAGPPVAGPPMGAGPMAGPPMGAGPMGAAPMSGRSMTGPRPGAHAARMPEPGPLPDPIPMPEPSRLAEHAARLSESAQYSAIPYSAVPQSAMPYSAVPYSAVPSSAMPYSATPYSGGRSGAPVSPAGYPQPAFSRGARSRQTQPKPAYRDDPYPTSGGSYSGYMPVSPAPQPFSAPPRQSTPPYPTHQAPAYPPSYEPNPPYQGHAPHDYGREAAYPAPAQPSWGSTEASANDTFSGLFARTDTPSGRYGFDGRSGPRARFSR